MSDDIEVVSSDWFSVELDRLEWKEQKWIAKRLAALVGKGWVAALSDGTIKHLQDGIWEIRVLGVGQAWRIFFFPAPARAMRLLVLTTCVSKAAVGKKRLLNLEVERAKWRRDQWFELHRGVDDEGRHDS